MFALGVLLSLFASIFKAGKGITTKIAVTRTDEYVTTWGYRIIGVSIYVLALLFTQSFVFPTELMFWGTILITSTGYSIGTILLTKAYKVSDVSLIAPLMSFVPIATSIPAWLLLKERPTPMAALGIIFVTIGAYTLQVHERDDGIFKPIRTLAQDRGTQYIGMYLLIIAVVPTFDKIGLTYVPPLTWATFQGLIVLAVLSIVLLFRRDQTDNVAIRKEWKVLFLLGAFNSGLVIAQLYAYKIMNVAYVQAIKRASILLVIVIGSIMFDEKHIKQRLVGGGIMLIGICLIVLFG